MCIDIILLKREIEIFRMCDHPNIINLYEVFEDEMFIHIVMEHCSGGDLYDNLIKEGRLTE